VQAALQSGKNLYHCVLYLAPGDYHRIHSACDWEIDHRTHFAGECMPVAPWLVERVPWLFTRNERIVLKGRWAHGFFSLCPVAALNVGNMKLALPNDDQLVTNRAWQRGLVNQTWVLQYLPAWAQKQIACTAEDLPTDHTWTHAPTTDPIVATTAYPKPYSPAVSSQKGQEIARFELGSTVVLVFEAEDCEFLIQPGQKVKLGQQIANVK
jgi:phosphatidylserine decarboxylase